MGMTKSVFGKTSNGEVVHLVTVSNEKGMSMEVLDYGATLVLSLIHICLRPGSGTETDRSRGSFR